MQSISIKQVHAKSILTPTKLPGSDFVINPYSGCLFGCVYCYADFTRKFTGHMDDEWGDYVDVKINTPELLEKELDRVMSSMKIKKTKYKNGKLPVIFLSSVTDPYMQIERKYKLTRRVLEILVERKFKGEVSILTKSPIVTRDIDLFKQLDHHSVGMTITTTDDEISRLFEKGAPPASERLKALKKLNQEGVNTYVFVGPLLPHFTSQKHKLEQLMDSILASGTRNVWFEHLNLSGEKKSRLIRLIGEKLGDEVMEEFMKSQDDEYKKELTEMVLKLANERGFIITGGDVIDHNKL